MLHELFLNIENEENPSNYEARVIPISKPKDSTTNENYR